MNERELMETQLRTARVFSPSTIDSSDIDFKKYGEDYATHAKVLSPLNWSEELLDYVRNGSRITGATLPWAKTHDFLRFRPGELTIWQGINGHGKSQLLGQACIWFAAQKESVCIASFEMKPVATMHRMLRQASMVSNPSEEFAQKFLKWMDKKIWIYNQLGDCTPEMIYAVVRYCAGELGIKHVVIDSLMKIVQGEDSYNDQKNLVSKLSNLSKDFNVHIHLVHHVRKLENEDKTPNKFDSKGSGAVIDLADQLITIFRNKRKERAMTAKLVSGNVDTKLADEFDAFMTVDKNRHDGHERTYGLGFHSPSLQYTGTNKCVPFDLTLMDAR